MTTIFIILPFHSASLKDREKIEVYNLVISAVNGASSPKLSGNTTVRIDVLDTNDEAPLFSKASYNETISEGDKAGTPVVIVSANDKDLVSFPLTFGVLFFSLVLRCFHVTESIQAITVFQGTNGRVLYRILYDDLNINVFSINQDSGEMILKNNIEDEEYRSLIVLVEAKDLGSPQPLASVVPVYVTVADVNDNQPIFDETRYRYIFSQSSY